MSGTSSLPSIVVPMVAASLWLLPQPCAYKDSMQGLQTSLQRRLRRWAELQFRQSALCAGLPHPASGGSLNMMHPRLSEFMLPSSLDFREYLDQMQEVRQAALPHTSQQPRLEPWQAEQCHAGSSHLLEALKLPDALRRNPACAGQACSCWVYSALLVLSAPLLLVRGSRDCVPAYPACSCLVGILGCQ